MERHYKVKEVADLFNIPVSTLHYWESIGLFEIPRNKENRYREYSLSDVMNIWEIMLYRDLDIPVKEVKEILNRDVEGLSSVYTANEESIDAQIASLKRKKEKIQIQKRLIKTLSDLKRQLFVESLPDLTVCKKDRLFQLESIEESLINPYQCVMYIGDTGNQEYCRGIALPPGEGEEVLWEREEATYLEFLLTMNFHDLSDNNLTEVVEQIREKGYKTGEVIARYLLIATEGERRLEYYRAWIRVCL